MKQELKYWTSVVKRLSLLIIIILVTLLSFKVAVFYLPFLIAFVISLLMEPVIKILMEKFKFSRRVSSIIVFVITFGIIIGVLIWGITTLISESTNLLAGFNNYYTRVYDQIQKILSSFDFSKIKVSNQMLDIIRNTSFSILEKGSNYIQNFFTNVVSIITSIPSIAIYFGVTILALYFICTDRIYMLDELEYHLPERWMKELTKHLRQLIKVLGGYLKAQLILVFISFLICLIGLYIFHFIGMNVGFPLIIAICIAFVDALPILGSGTIMVPWGIISGLNGDIKLGIAIIVLWITMSIVRQFVEPKIVSGSIGIHPIFTIIAMYTGFRFLGVIGMFIGPIILIILKNVFSNFLDKGFIKGLLDLE